MATKTRRLAHSLMLVAAFAVASPAIAAPEPTAAPDASDVTGPAWRDFVKSLADLRDSAKARADHPDAAYSVR